MAIGQRIGLPLIAAKTLQLFAGIGAANGDYQRRARLLGAANALTAGGPARLFTEQLNYDRTIQVLRGALATAQLTGLLREGAAWSMAIATDETALV